MRFLKSLSLSAIAAILLAGAALAQTEDFAENYPWQGSPSEAEKKLWMGAYYGRMEDVKSAIAEGASANFKGKGGFTPIVVAARNGHLDVIKYMVAHGADINKRDNIRNKGALLAAAFKSQDATAAYLLEHGAQPDAQGVNGWTALHDAAFVGDYTIVRMLVEHGADAGILNNAGMTALKCAEMGRGRARQHGNSNATDEDYQKTIDYLSRQAGGRH